MKILSRIVLITTVHCATAWSQPQLRLEQTRVRWEKVTQGKVLNVKVHFSNHGDTPLVIHGLHAACKCISMNQDWQVRYLKGERGVLNFSLNTSTFLGPIRKQIQVFSNDKQRPLQNIFLEANIVADVQSDPKVLVFSDQRTIDVSIESSSPVIISGLRYNHSLLQITQKKLSLKVHLKKQYHSHDLFDAITVTTTSPSKPTLKIPVMIKAKKPIKLHPQHLDFGVISKGGTMSRSLRGNLPLQAQGVHLADGSYLEVEWKVTPGQKPNEPDDYIVTLKHQANIKGHVYGTLELLAAMPGNSSKKLYVPVFAFMD